MALRTRPSGGASSGGASSGVYEEPPPRAAEKALDYADTEWPSGGASSGVYEEAPPRAAEKALDANAEWPSGGVSSGVYEEEQEQPPPCHEWIPIGVYEEEEHEHRIEVIVKLQERYEHLQRLYQSFDDSPSEPSGPQLTLEDSQEQEWPRGPSQPVEPPTTFPKLGACASDQP